MMAQERVDRDEQELHDWYEYNKNDDAPTDNNIINNDDDLIHNNNINNNNAPIDPAEECVEWQRAETDLHHRLQDLFMMVLQLMWRWRITSNNVHYLTSVKRSSIADGNAFMTALNSSV
jgi:hypothetical protein